MRYIYAMLIALVGMIFVSSANACPDGYYEACFGGCVCLPNSGEVVEPITPTNPLPDILDTINGAVSGDMGSS